MKKTIILLVLLVSQFAFGQSSIVKTEFFSFECECKEVENQFNSINKSYNYSYLNNKDNKTGYMISVKKTSEQSRKSFLNIIKNSNTFKYSDINFLKYKAISADININGQYAKHIAFFVENNAFTIMIIGNSQTSVNQLYLDLKKSFRAL